MKAILFFFTVIISITASTQSAVFPVQQLATSWEVIENNHAGKRQFLSGFTFRNTSNTAFPASGWSLFFNFPRMIDAKTLSPQMKVEHINGDFYRVTPTASFKGLQPKDSVKITFVSGAWAISITDAPGSPYIVWDNTPEKGYALTNYTVNPSTQPKQYLRYEGDKVELTTPAITYAQNTAITDVPVTALTKVFPTPASYKEGQGAFVLDKNSAIISTAQFQPEAGYLQKELERLIGSLPINGTSKGKGEIRLQAKPMAKEAYELTVAPEAVTIAASTNAGLFYGIQSLKTLLPAIAWQTKQQRISIPAVQVIDSPRFEHRAFMLDVARNFQTKAQLLRTLDLMALYKLNVFHFHFSDDEGWRIEIPGLPELTEVGARRGHALNDANFLHPSFGSGPDLSGPGSGYYTRADFIEILKYANERHIRLIPEIETPGHARAAVASMKARYNRLMKEGKQQEAEAYLLADLNDSSVYRSVQRWTNNVMDVSLPSTYRFLEKVTDELIAMYTEAGVPLERIHFGGDEVPGGVWTKSPAVKQLMQKEPSVKNVNDLWYYFFGNINKMLEKKGLLLYGWEEIAMRKTQLDSKATYIPNPDFVNNNVQVDVWNNVIGWGAEDLPYQLANAGYKVILSPVSNMYFDLAYEKAFDEPGQYWGGYIDTDKPFTFIPFDYYKSATHDVNGNRVTKAFFDKKERLTDYGKEQIPGIQGLLWAETLSSPAKMEYLMLPKLLGLAERAWSPDPAWANEKDSVKAQALYKQAWSQFVNTLGKTELPRLDFYAGGFQYRIPAPGSIVENGLVKMNSQLPGFTIYYTTDGTEPTPKSTRYTKPFSAKGIIKARVFSPNGRGGRTITITEAASKI
jgi:hexosaminidase